MTDIYPASNSSTSTYPTGTALRGEANLTTALDTACRTFADRVAISDCGTTLTYRDLAERVGQAAAGLTRHYGPLRPGEAVAIAAPAGMDAVCAVLAILTAGGAYLPLDLDTPPAYRDDLVSQTGCRIVVTSHAAAGNAGRASEDNTLDVVDVAQLIADGYDRDAPTAGMQIDGREAAYVIFTSGSTGRPKGVVLPHTAMLHSTAARVDAYGIPGRVPLLHSPAVDVYSGVLFWALLSGGTLVIGPSGLRDVPATAALLTDEGITDLVYLSSLYPLLLDIIDATTGTAAAGVQAPSALRRAIIGSDRWTDTVIDRHLAVLPNVALHNEYGPTEAAVWTSQACVWEATTATRAALTIGRPSSGTGYHLLDSDGVPCLPRESDEPGELVISGAQLALGYLDPGQNTDRFITLPDGQRGYRTGDLATVNPDGTYVFAGRTDRQLKIQGARIEPGHIETLLMGQPGVALAHVIARTDLGPGAVLTAYLVTRPGASPDLDRIGADLAGQLPAALVPTAWVLCDELPRTTGGKIDEAALPPPTATTRPLTGPLTGPADPLEAAIAAAVAEILGRPIDVATPLNNAAASSLALISLATRIMSEHQVQLPVSFLFTAPTVRRIAAAVREARERTAREPGTGGLPPLVAVAHDPNGSPLSRQQQQVFTLNQLAPDSRAYHTQCTLHLHGPLNVLAMQAALTYVVGRHDILRTTVHLTSSQQGCEPLQRVHPAISAAPVDLPVTDLRAVPDEDVIGELEWLVAEQTWVGFDTARLPLVRWHLYRLADQRWVLLQVEHHLIHDGWTANLLLAEIRDSYAAFAAGRTPELPPLPVSYRDWVVWQRAWGCTEGHAAQRRYWTQQLASVPAHGVSFTPDRPRPPRQTFIGELLRTTVDAHTMARLDDLAAGHGITRFAVLLTAFALLVRHHTGVDDMIIGSALANRRVPGTDRVLGMFVNALPLRLRVGENATIADTAYHTMRILLEAQDHQEFPFTDLVAALDLPRDSSRSPLFSLMFACHDTPRPDFDIPGPHGELDGDLHGELHIEHNSSAKNDLNVICVPRPAAGTVEILWEYNSDLFTARTAQHLLDSYMRILTALTNPSRWGQAADALDVVDPQAARQVLAAAQGPVQPPAYDAVHDGVTAQIARTPDAPALVCGTRTLTYRELGHAATAVEQQLADAGVAVGDRVVIACGPGLEHAAACLAVLRRGAAYLCLDPTEPADRLTRLVDDARPSVFVLSPATDTPVLRGVAGTAPVVVASPDTAPPVTVPAAVEVAGDDPAYLVYTSGSAGTPKAVMASHRNAVTAMTARTVYTHTHDTPADGTGSAPAPARTLITLPPQFDVAASMVFWTWWTGGTVVFPDGADTRDPAVVRTLIDRHAITHVNFVASYYQQLLAALPPGSAASLRTVAIGGEPCPPQLVHEHAARLPHAALDNEYGPTETAVWCTAARLHERHTPTGTPHPGAPAARIVPARTAHLGAADRAPQQGRTGGAVTVGRPLANYAVHVVDERLQPVPAGTRGELCVAGPGVCSGYLDRPELTAERFVTAAHGPLAGTRLYRTGDEGRQRLDGTIELFGRFDEQVKVRGFRIELGEIRTCLLEHPAVSAAHIVVDTAEGQNGRGARLFAYVAASDASSLPASSAAGPQRLGRTLRDRCAARLPAYMVPAAVVVLPALPLTATGKVDQAALPAPVTGSDSGNGTVIEDAPDALHRGNQVEERVVAVWHDLLGIDRIGVDDDWFALGGDSLTAIRAAAILRDRGLPITVADFLHSATVRGIAARVTAPTDLAPADVPEEVSGGYTAGPGSIVVTRRAGGTVLPLTAMQAWFFAQQFAEPHHFNQARLFPVPAGVARVEARAALQAVVDRHDAFRTRFRRTATGWVAVLDEQPPTIQLHELVLATPAAEQTAEPVPKPVAEEVADTGSRDVDQLHRELHLERGPLWAAAMVTDERGQRQLLLVAHHLIVDAVSFTVIGHDLAVAFREPGTPLPTAPPVPDPRDLPDNDEAAFWSALADREAPRLRLPEPPADQSSGMLRRAPYRALHHVEVTVPVHTTRYLLDVARRGRATVTGLLCAALHEALAPRTVGDGLYLFLEGHGRHETADAEQIVGWLTSLYPILLQPGPAQHLLSVADRFTRQLAAVPRTGTGYATARYLHPDSPLGAQLAGTASPEITVNYLGHRADAAARAQQDPRRGVRSGVGQTIGPGNVLPTLLHVTAAIDGDTMWIRLSHDVGALPADEGTDVGRRLVALLDRAAGLEPLTKPAAASPAPAPAAATTRRQFVVHPVDGQVHWFQPLADRLAATWETFGLRADPADSTLVRPVGIDALAARYVERIREVQPHGPYAITGWSFGAAVALAMAVQLEAAGEHVRPLVLLDPPALPVADTHHRVGDLISHLRALLPDRTSDQIAAAAAAVLGEDLLDPASRADVVEHHAGPLDPFVRERLTVLLHHHQALAGWEPTGTVTHLHLVQPDTVHGHGTTTAQDLGHNLGRDLDGDVSRWLAYARIADRTTVPGDHRTMLTGPALDALAVLYQPFAQQPADGAQPGRQR